jgi:hypothetical protein
VNLSKSNRSRTNRSAKRIPLQIRLTVTGKDEYGTAFADQVRTENLSIDGGCLLLNRDLRRNQSLRIEGQTAPALLRRYDGVCTTSDKIPDVSVFNWKQTPRRVGY